MAAKAKEVALSHNLNADHFVKVIECETMHSWDPFIQSTYPNERDGGRELSFGLVQIHLPDHKNVSKEQAQDPEFAFEFMADYWDQGQENQWSCYRKLNANGWVLN